MARRDKLIRDRVRDRFVYTLRTGDAFEGLLVEVDDKTLRIADAWAVRDKSRVSIDGEMYLPRADVLYMQRTGGGT